MRSIRCFLVVVMLLTWLFVSEASLTCSGSALSSKGLFCFNQKKDVNSLMGSLAESGLTSESMLVSGPKPVVRVVIVNPYSATTTTTTSQPATTTSPAPPPARRRAVPNGLAVCEDVFGSDILDSDCYATRYRNLTGGMFDQLSAMSSMLSTARTYVSKLEPVLNQIIVPGLQINLGTAIQRGVSDFSTGMDKGTTAVLEAEKKANTSTISLVSGLESSSKTSTSALATKTGAYLDSLLSIELQNINAMIDRANQMNKNSTVSKVLNVLEDIGANGTGWLRNHSNDVIGMTGNLTTQSSWLSNQLLMATTNFTMSQIPQVTGSTVYSSAARSSRLLEKNTGAISRVINSEALKEAAGTLHEINGAISDSLTEQLGKIDAKMRYAMSQIDGINSKISFASDQLSETVTSLPAQYSRISAPTMRGIISFSNLGALINQFSSQVAINETGQVRNWNIGAQSALSNLNQLLSLAASGLGAGVDSGSEKSVNSLTSTILHSLAQVGSVQMNLTNTLLQSQQAGINAVNAVIGNLSESGVSFSKIMQTIVGLITMLNGTEISPLSPLGAFMTLPARMQSLAANVSSAASNSSNTLNFLNATIASNISTYINNQSSFWVNQSSSEGLIPALLSQTGETAVNQANGDIDSSLSSWVNSQRSIVSTSAAAYSANSNSANILNSQQSEALRIIADTLSHVSGVARYAMGNITNTVTLGPANYSVLWGTEKPAIDAVNHDYLIQSATVKGKATEYSRKLSEFNSTLQPDSNAELEEISNESSFIGKLQRASSDNSKEANTDADSLANAIDKENSDVTASILSINKSIESGQISTSQSSVSSALSSLNNEAGSPSKASKSFSQKIANQAAVLASIHATIERLVSSIEGTNSALSSNTNAADNLVVLIGLAINIAQLLSLEIEAIQSGESSANAADIALLSRLNSTLNQNITSLNSRAGLVSPTDWNSVVDPQKALLDSASRTIDAPPEDYLPTYASTVNSTVLRTLTDGILAAAAAYRSASNVSKPTLDQVHAVKRHIDGSILPRLESENNRLESLLTDISMFANSTYSTEDKRALLVALSSFETQLKQTQGMSVAQAAALVVNSSISLQQAMDAMSSIASISQLVGETQAMQTAERNSRVSAVQSKLTSSSNELNSMLKKAIINSTSSSALKQNLGLDSSTTLSQLAINVANELKILSSSFKNTDTRLNSSGKSLSEEIEVSLSSLSGSIQTHQNTLRAAQSQMRNIINGWTNSGDISMEEREIESASSSFQLDASLPSQETSDFTVNLFPLKIQSGADPIAKAALDQVSQAVEDVESMLAQTTT